MLQVRVQESDFDLSAESKVLHSAACGALCSFVGVVRQAEQGHLAALELEHYPGMTESAIYTILEAAQERFALQAATVVHRVGRLPLGAQIVLVLVASAHRHAAFSGCAFVMDYLKTQAPFWKKEIDHTGCGLWVDARASDDAALQRWGVHSSNAVQDQGRLATAWQVQQ